MKRSFQFVDANSQKNPKKAKTEEGYSQEPSIIYRESSSMSCAGSVESSPLRRKTPLTSTILSTPTKPSDASSIADKRIPDILHSSPHRWKTPEKSLMKQARSKIMHERSVMFTDPQLHDTWSKKEYDRSPSMESLLKYKRGIIKRKDWIQMTKNAKHIGNRNTVHEKRMMRRTGKLSPNSTFEKILEDSQLLRDGGYADNLWSHVKNVIDFLNPYKSLE